MGRRRRNCGPEEGDGEAAERRCLEEVGLGEVPVALGGRDGGWWTAMVEIILQPANKEIKKGYARHFPLDKVSLEVPRLIRYSKGFNVFQFASRSTCGGS